MWCPRFSVGDLVKSRVNYNFKASQPGTSQKVSNLVVQPTELYIILGQSDPDESPERWVVSDRFGIIGDVNGSVLEQI